MDSTMSSHRQDNPVGAPPFDLTKRYVRLNQVRADGFVEFQFAIGDPELAVDLILPAEAYREFCRDNKAVLVSPLPTLCTSSPGETHVG
jgi:phenol/toluene 2-monooxygenase (NADH) P0/A0